MAFVQHLQSTTITMQPFPIGLTPNIQYPNTSSFPCPRLQCFATKTRADHQTALVERRSANYQPSVWDFDYIQSLQNEYASEESHKNRADELKEQVKVMLDEVVDQLSQLELIDILQRLGLSYHFEVEVERILRGIYSNSEKKGEEYWKGKDLYAAALEFRLLRQHGHNVPQEVFTRFIDESSKNFKECFGERTKGMLSLYEASFLLVEGESILERAREYATKHLQDHVNNHNKPKNSENGHDDDDELSIALIKHALELPLHWRVTRVESRWFIEFYERRQDKSDVLLELAKLDYNMVQAIHQDDLKKTSRWWNDLGLAENLKFSRDRLMENFLWQTGIASEPRLGYYRRKAAQVFALITTIDDVYDIYGTLDELKLFTDAVERWDINAIEHLPDYMKICFVGLYNSTNEIAFDILKEKRVHIISYLIKGWTGLCKAYLKEARWYYSGHKPSLEEYMDNAWISISIPVIMDHTYFLVQNPLTEEALECLEKHHNIILWSATILRLADDLGTSSHEIERGDILKSVQCYMHETGASEEDARKHIWHLISETWKKLNEVDEANYPFSRDFINIAKNVGRMSLSMYQHGDGHASQDQCSVDRVRSLLVQPFPLV